MKILLLALCLLDALTVAAEARFHFVEPAIASYKAQWVQAGALWQHDFTEYRLLLSVLGNQ